MIKLAIIAILLFLVSIAVSAQSGPRTFDNFDRSQGVQVFYRPGPLKPAEKPQTARRGSRWVVKVEDKLAAKPTMSVAEGVAQPQRIAPTASTRMVMGTASHLGGFTTGNALHDSYIVESSRRYNIDPLLIYSQMHQESSFKVNATSHKGASGLMQLMPATARRFGVTKIYDPRQNIDAGVKYMRWLLDTFNGDFVLALAGYNAGEGAVMKYGWRVPPYRETQEYVRRISARYNTISNPGYVRPSLSSAQVASKIGQKESRPLAVYEPDPIAIRTADGKMMLFNQ
jgi:soluble lytic murein transglycosylase-like protein